MLSVEQEQKLKDAGVKDEVIELLKNAGEELWKNFPKEVLYKLVEDIVKAIVSHTETTVDDKLAEYALPAIKKLLGF